MRHAALILAFLILATGGIPQSVAAEFAATGENVLGPDTEIGLGTSDEPTAATARNVSVDTEIIIDVHANSNATWKVVTRHSLQSEADVRGFERLVGKLNNGEANSSLDESTFRNYAALASEATGREMTIRDVSYTGEVTEDNSTGVLTMSFTWTNFAEQTDNDQLRVGDAFTAPDGGTWFPWLADGQRLVVGTPRGYEVKNSFTGIRNGSVVATGPMDLRPAANPIYVVYVGSNGPPLTSDPLYDALSPELIAGMSVMVVLVVAGVLYLRQQEEGFPQPMREGDRAVAAAGGSQTVPDEESGEDASKVDLSLLSDEERVEHILEEEGGRMRQADIVKKTGWSDAKVSQLLSAMADEERINKLRIGRENLISLPDEEKPPAGEESSPSGDE